MFRIVLLGSALALVGCSKKKTAPEEAVSMTEPAPVLEMKEVEPEPTAVEQAVARMEENFARVFFGFDSAELNADALRHLEMNAKIMQKHPDVKVEIHGHADERGTTDYNLALAMKRADRVRTALTNMGVSPSRLSVVSYGEERPLKQGSRPAVWSMNRRAEFNVLVNPDGMVDGTLDNPIPDESELIMDGPQE